MTMASLGTRSGSKRQLYDSADVPDDDKESPDLPKKKHAKMPPTKGSNDSIKDVDIIVYDSLVSRADLCTASPEALFVKHDGHVVHQETLHHVTGSILQVNDHYSMNPITVILACSKIKQQRSFILTSLSTIPLSELMYSTEIAASSDNAADSSDNADASSTSTIDDSSHFQSICNSLNNDITLRSSQQPKAVKHFYLLFKGYAAASSGLGSSGVLGPPFHPIVDGTSKAQKGMGNQVRPLYCIVHYLFYVCNMHMKSTQ